MGSPPGMSPNVAGGESDGEFDWTPWIVGCVLLVGVFLFQKFKNAAPSRGILRDPQKVKEAEADMRRIRERQQQQWDASATEAAKIEAEKKAAAKRKEIEIKEASIAGRSARLDGDDDTSGGSQGYSLDGKIRPSKPFTSTSRPRNTGYNPLMPNGGSNVRRFTPTSRAAPGGGGG